MLTGSGTESIRTLFGGTEATFRIWFGDRAPGGPAAEATQSVLAKVVGAGVLTEWCSPSYVAIDASPSVDVAAISGVLENLEKRGLIESYEVGKVISTS
jgi:hypothetical protein